MLVLKGATFVLMHYIEQHQPLTATVEDLAEGTGYHENTVKRVLAGLREAGLLEAEPVTRRGPFTYTIVEEDE